ncbi:helix-turn-helix transcriptional regulator [Aneurinibacillus terranovensis]|uniref:helix-turn-helix transcriptional regulator n=1 Tax=Aneurinibacillus terranovensis TaxID=278991 RepID=UPI0004219572|nr:helix-turn-helix domain-containing protein [Aneurinibacillus terranovensis]
MDGEQQPTFTKETFNRLISEKIRLIRTEANLTQEQMADVIGLSKKTLVQVEKERKTLGFTASALVGVLFRESEIIQAIFGESVLDLIDLIAFHETGREPSGMSMDWIQRAKAKARYKTMGKPIWWKEEKAGHAYSLQTHILTGHFRIVDRENALHYYGLDEDEANKQFNELEK